MKCDIQFASQATGLPKKAKIQKVLHFLSQEFDLKDQSLSLRIVDPEESQALNLAYRGKANPTNVLSFSYQSVEDFALPVEMTESLGDLVLCHAVIAQEAQAQQKTLNNHYTHLIIHGLLHLLGYDHETDKEAQEMEALEIDLLKTLNINNPYEDTHHGA